MHDATGTKRKGSLKGKLVILVFIVVVAAVAWWAYNNKDKWQKGPESNPVPLNSSEATPAPQQ